MVETLKSDQEVRRYTGELSGLSWEVEACPDCVQGDTLKAAAGGGLIAWGAAMLLGIRSPGRLLAGVVGAAAGALASNFHMNFDWDPDRFRGEAQQDEDEDDGPAEAQPPKTESKK